jgi:hypothetical protein
VCEVGKYIDFHDNSASTVDNITRLTASPGALTCTGTFSAPNIVSSNPRIFMFLGTAQNLTSGAETIISYNSVDSGGMTNSTGVVTIPGAGAYVVSAGWATTTQGADYLTYTAVLSQNGAVKQHQAWNQSITCVVFFTGAGNISVSALQNSGTTRTLQTGKVNTWLNIYRLA